MIILFPLLYLALCKNLKVAAEKEEEEDLKLSLINIIKELVQQYEQREKKEKRLIISLIRLSNSIQFIILLLLL